MEKEKMYIVRGDRRKMKEIKRNILVLKPIVYKSETMKKEYERILSEYKNGVINIGNYFNYEVVEITNLFLEGEER